MTTNFLNIAKKWSVLIDLQLDLLFLYIMLSKYKAIYKETYKFFYDID